MTLTKIPARQLDLGLAESFVPSAEDPAGNQIKVAGGKVKDGITFYYSAEQTTVGFNPVSSALYSRWDLVYIDLESVVHVIQGTESLNPVPDFYGMPDFPAYSFPIAAVKITEPGAVIVEQTDIIDIRPLLNMNEERVYDHNYVVVDDMYYQEAIAALDTDAQTMAEFSGRDTALQTVPEYSTKGAPEYAITDDNTLALAIALLDAEAKRVKDFTGKDNISQNAPIYSTKGAPKYAVTDNSTLVRAIALLDAEAKRVKDFIGKSNISQNAPDYSGFTTHNYISANDPIRDAVGKIDAALKENISIPVGAIIAYLGSTDDLVDPDIPTNWLECDGALISRTTYSELFTELGETFGAGNGLTTFALPDLRGQFLRGYDHAKGVDIGRAYCSYQADRLKDHTHATKNYIKAGVANLLAWVGEDIGNDDSGTSGVNPPNNGAIETAPKNYAVVWLIKY